MKHINVKNIISGVSVGVILLAGFMGMQTFAEAPGGGATSAIDNRYLNNGGNSNSGQPGLLDIFTFELAPKTLQTIGLGLGTTSLLGSTNPIIFRIVGTSIFDNIVAYDESALYSLFTGYSTIPIFTSGDPLLQVDGTVRIEALGGGGVGTYRKLCTDDFGILSAAAVGTECI